MAERGWKAEYPALKYIGMGKTPEEIKKLVAKEKRQAKKASGEGAAKNGHNKGITQKNGDAMQAEKGLLKTFKSNQATLSTFRALGIEGKGTRAEPFTYNGEKLPFDLNKARANWDPHFGRFVYSPDFANTKASKDAIDFLNNLVDDYHGDSGSKHPKVNEGTRVREQNEGYHKSGNPSIKHSSLGRFGKEVFDPTKSSGLKKEYERYRGYLGDAKKYLSFSNDPKLLQRDMNTYSHARNSVEEMDKKLEANPNAFKEMPVDQQNHYLRSMAICHYFESSPEYSQVKQDYDDHRYKNGYVAS